MHYFHVLSNKSFAENLGVLRYFLIYSFGRCKRDYYKQLHQYFLILQTTAYQFSEIEKVFNYLGVYQGNVVEIFKAMPIVHCIRYQRVICVYGALVP